MSCVAAASATASVRASATHGVSGRLPTPESARPESASATCATAIQPRRRPQNGSRKRSMSGDQRNLKVHGACARVKSPTTRMSTPIERIQSGIAIQTSPSGSPDENDSATTAATRDSVPLRASSGAPATGSLMAGGL